MKKLILPIIFIVALIVYKGTSNKKSPEHKVENQCKGTEDYKYGYEAGHGQAIIGAINNCDSYLKTTNNGYGPIGTISDCWRDGFYDGYVETK